MKLTRPQILPLLILVFTLFCCDHTWAQAPLEPSQMPARTTFYVIWRGTPPVMPERQILVLALWDDPDLAPLRAAALQNMQSSSAKDPSKSQLSREELEQTSSLLENSFVLGYLRKPETKAPAAKFNEHPWNGMFLVYDRTGKELLLAKTVLRFLHPGKRASANFHRHRRRRPRAQNRSKRQRQLLDRARQIRRRLRRSQCLRGDSCPP